MDEKQVNGLFEVIRKSKPTARQNIRTLYLDRIGENIVQYCIKYYSLESSADVRNDLLRFTIQYARKSKEVIDFAKTALMDKSKKVRRTGLSIFAFAGDKNHLDYLNSKKGLLQGNEEDLQNAIYAIKEQNHHLFYPKYDKWMITTSDTKRHLNKEEFKKDVELYIEKFAKEAVPGLRKILGCKMY